MSSGDSSADSLVASVLPLIASWRLDRAFDYRVPPALAAEVRIGSLVRVPLARRRVRGVVTAVRAPLGDEQDLREVAGVIVPPALCPPPLDELLDWLARRYAVPRGLAFARIVPPRVRVSPSQAGSSRSGPEPCELFRYRGGRELLDVIESGAAGAWLLRVLPGEDRAGLIAELVGAAGRAPSGAALVTVPEVAHASPVLERLQRDWPEVARVDSALPEADRARAWLRLASGHPVGAGGRAAVLAPVPSLRLLVVDEEQDASYKEERAPRYDARRVALERARLQRAVCVFISTAPSIEAGFATRSGQLGLAEPDRAAARAARPIVEVCPRPADGTLSHQLQRRVRDALRDGQKVALVLPNRGYARVVWCASCRRSLRCPACARGLSFDRDARRLRCAACGHSSDDARVCPSCGSSQLRYFGVGSQRLAEQLARAFPRAGVQRVDSDVYRSFSERAEDADIYVTTWIGTKEWLRPAVSVVGVVDLDFLLRRADFRAAEHAYQALVQMSEWAGPSAGGGRLVVQSDQPVHHAVQAVVRADYAFFLERELTQRAELGYPPHSELVKVQGWGPRRKELMGRVADACAASGGRVLGPAGVTVRSGGRRLEALEVLVKSADAERVASALRGILADVPPDNRLVVDVDPR